MFRVCRELSPLKSKYTTNGGAREKALDDTSTREAEHHEIPTHTHQDGKDQDGTAAAQTRLKWL